MLLLINCRLTLAVSVSSVQQQAAAWWKAPAPVGGGSPETLTQHVVELRAEGGSSHFSQSV